MYEWNKVSMKRKLKLNIKFALQPRKPNIRTPSYPINNIIFGNSYEMSKLGLFNCTKISSETII